MQKQQQGQIVGKQVSEAAVQASHEAGGDTTDGRDGREPFMSEGMVDVTARLCLFVCLFACLCLSECVHV